MVVLAEMMGCVRSFTWYQEVPSTSPRPRRRRIQIGRCHPRLTDSIFHTSKCTCRPQLVRLNSARESSVREGSIGPRGHLEDGRNEQLWTPEQALEDELRALKEGIVTSDDFLKPLSRRGRAPRRAASDRPSGQNAVLHSCFPALLLSCSLLSWFLALMLSGSRALLLSCSRTLMLSCSHAAYLLKLA